MRKWALVEGKVEVEEAKAEAETETASSTLAVWAAWDWIARRCRASHARLIVRTVRTVKTVKAGWLSKGVHQSHSLHSEEEGPRTRQETTGALWQRTQSVNQQNQQPTRGGSRPSCVA